jgi:SAM-dependent methyltransferase
VDARSSPVLDAAGGVPSDDLRPTTSAQSWAGRVAYDPTIYLGSAAHYLRGRPPYSDELAEVARRELRLDGRGRLLDVGCGPGVVAVQLAPLFEHVTGLDPDPDMLVEAQRHALASGAKGIEWILARAEDLPSLGLPPMRVVTFGQSYHWTDREAVAEAVYDLLEPGGAIVMITHDIEARPRPEGPGDPLIPDDEMQALIRTHLGEDKRSGQGLADPPPDRYQDALLRTRFGASRAVLAPGREDLTRDVDGVIAGYLSMSYAAPHLFGDSLDAFVEEARALLEERTSTGWFWDWPGDTWLLIATKPA